MPKFQFVKTWGPTLNRVNSQQEEGMITVADVKRLADFLNAEYEKARATALAGGALDFTWKEWAADIGISPVTLSKYRRASGKVGPVTDIIADLADYFYGKYGKDGHSALLQAAGVWGKKRKDK